MWLLFADAELVYRDPTGGLSIISTNNLSTRTLMTNSTFVSLITATFSTFHFTVKQNVEHFNNWIWCFSSLFLVFPWQRQLNAVKFLVSPDLNFVVLIADIDEDGAKWVIDIKLYSESNQHSIQSTVKLNLISFCFPLCLHLTTGIMCMNWIHEIIFHWHRKWVNVKFPSYSTYCGHQR